MKFQLRYGSSNIGGDPSAEEGGAAVASAPAVRVVLFAAGGTIPVEALGALRRVAAVVAVVRPGPPPGLVMEARRLAGRLVRGLPLADTLTQAARSAGVPTWWFPRGSEGILAERIRAERVDLACIATFPWRLPDALLAAPTLGAVNVHPSLLPRHRGPNPWFWTYVHDDREVGITVHQAVARLDAGPILAQARWPLARGCPLLAWHREAAARGADLLAGVVAGWGDAPPAATPQDEALATRAPSVPATARALDARWPAERCWHVLAGLAGRRREPLTADGAPVPYDLVPGFEERTPSAAPGTVERMGRGAWRLWCIDGAVHLARRGH